MHTNLIYTFLIFLPLHIAFASDWNYKKEKNNLFNNHTNFASLVAKNIIGLRPPHEGGTATELTLFHNPTQGKQAAIVITRGDFECPRPGLCPISVIFDNRKPKKIFAKGEIGEANVRALVIHDYEDWVADLKNSKQLKIDARFEKNGIKRMEFNTEGLKWEFQ